jgi:murein DD-endopeptidase MepM/ murein hydrolase activator NlpD
MKISKPSKGGITSQYGMRVLNGVKQFHPGIDFAAGAGADVYSFAAGKVVGVYGGCSVGNMNCNGGAGNFVVIDHENGFFTRYLHLTSITVKQGDRVVEGSKIGTEGNTGFSYGSHLHFELRTDALYGQKGSVDPNPYLNGTKVFPDSKKN